VKPLSKESIRKITEAEDKAREIIEQANQRAKAMYAETEQKSKEDREQLEAETEQRLRKLLEDMRAHSEGILRRSSENAQKDAENMNKMAEFHMEEAVKAIVWGIKEQCQ
jgi:vacuolar-type H+-ATPase subunit H